MMDGYFMQWSGRVCFWNLNIFHSSLEASGPTAPPLPWRLRPQYQNGTHSWSVLYWCQEYLSFPVSKIGSLSLALLPVFSTVVELILSSVLHEALRSENLSNLASRWLARPPASLLLTECSFADPQQVRMDTSRAPFSVYTYNQLLPYFRPYFLRAFILFCQARMLLRDQKNFL